MNEIKHKYENDYNELVEEKNEEILALKKNHDDLEKTSTSISYYKTLNRSKLVL